MASNIVTTGSGACALVLGANGQDGSYLCEHLHAQGLIVHGVGRQIQSQYMSPSPRFHYHRLDLFAERHSFSTLLDAIRPDLIFHVAATHGAAGFIYEDSWQSALQVNTGSVHQCLEYIRVKQPTARLLYASSVKAFDREPPEIVSENLFRHSTCLYSITKNAAVDLISYYRKSHGVQAVSLFLFNHESPRRARHFFLPRVTELFARALLKTGLAQSSRDLMPQEVPQPLQSLDFQCDWGSSSEYMALAIKLLQAGPSQDYVMATGRSWTGEEFVRELFGLAKLRWQDHVNVLTPPGGSPIHNFSADISRLEAVLGGGPRATALDVAKWILAENYGITHLANA